MSEHESIDHLDDDTKTPFDAIVALDHALTVYRAALHAQLELTTFDAVRSSEESDLLYAGHLLWCAREALVSSVDE